MTLQRMAVGGVALVTLLLLLAVSLRQAIGETLEGPTFSTALGVVGGLAVGSLLVVMLGARRSRS